MSNPALDAVPVNSAPGPEYGSAMRRWQGIPGIARTRGGRLYATWYSGGTGECKDNYSLLVRSEDDGTTWSEPIAVVDPPGGVRSFDPMVWCDPQGRLWWVWAQTSPPEAGGIWDGRGGIWTARLDQPDDETSAWTAPERLGDGIALNKPTIPDSGEWLLPAAVWVADGHMSIPGIQRAANVLASTDAGETWELRGGAVGPERIFDEHMIVQLPGRRLWMLARTRYGIAESFSNDRGWTWSGMRPAALAGPSSRFYIGRLPSGRLLLINHHGGKGRSNLCALLSDDDGQTWPHCLRLDERNGVSYPDVDLAPDDRIFVIWDFDRYGQREISLAVITEDDIEASCGGRRELVNRATGPSPKEA